MKYLNVHFVLLTIGSAVFLYNFSEADVSGSGDRTLLEIWALSRRLTLLAYYAIFVSLVIGHGALHRSTQGDTDRIRADAAEKDVRT